MYSRQYMSAIFPNNPHQLKLAQETQKEYIQKYNVSYAEIIENSEFYIAEEYHQKYWLQNTPILLKIFLDVYNNMNELLSSMTAAKTNGYIRGYSKPESLHDDFFDFYWKQKKKEQEKLLEILEE